jgi:hypothetical protein
MRTPWIMAGLLVAGCGSAPHKPAAGPDRLIRAVVQLSYNTTDTRDCGRLFTTGFLRDIYGGRAGCEKNVRTRRKRRAVRVTAIRRQGPVADARIRMNGIAATVKVVLAGRQWRVNDVIGSDGSVRDNLVQGRQARKPIHAAPPQPLGTVESFHPLPQTGPKASFTVQVLEVVPDGHLRNGVRTAYGPVTNEFGAVTTRVKFRVVNVKVRLTGSGPRPFKGTFSAFLSGTNGRRWPEVQHTGRLPDWSDGESRGIAPGHSVTRWLSFGIPFASLPKVVELQPELLSQPDTVTIVEPATGRWLASSGR